MTDFIEVSEEVFINVEKEFATNPGFSVSVDPRVEPTCVTIKDSEGVIARALMPKYRSLVDILNKKLPQDSTYHLREDLITKFS